MRWPRGEKDRERERDRERWEDFGDRAEGDLERNRVQCKVFEGERETDRPLERENMRSLWYEAPPAPAS